MTEQSLRQEFYKFVKFNGTNGMEGDLTHNDTNHVSDWWLYKRKGELEEIISEIHAIADGEFALTARGLEMAIEIIKSRIN